MNYRKKWKFVIVEQPIKSSYPKLIYVYNAVPVHIEGQTIFNRIAMSVGFLNHSIIEHK